MTEHRGPLSFPDLPQAAVRVALWEGQRRPNEDEFRAALAADGYQPVKWSSEPYQAYVPHAHIYPELLWLLAGNLVVVLPEPRRMLELQPGDRVELPPGTVHAVLAGSDGAVYLAATRGE
jgi:quercetin dioxygenase-like cupin family protein